MFSSIAIEPSSRSTWALGLAENGVSLRRRVADKGMSGGGST